MLESYLVEVCKEVCKDLSFILVNYQGSISYGQDNIVSLPGNRRSNFVQDIIVGTENNYNYNMEE